MFSKTIVDSDDFLDMPVSARLLYYDLGMRADDDGFVNPKRVMRLTGSPDDDLKILLVKKYVLEFENKVLVIRDWKVNNFIRPDRYTPTIYKQYLKRLKIEETNQYMLTSGIPDDIPDDIPAVYAGKGSIELGKDTDIYVSKKLHEYYQERINKNSLLTDKAKNKIKTRLKTFTPKQLATAIYKFSKNAWQMEHNYNRGIAWFYHSDERIEQYINLKEDTRCRV